MVPSKDVAQTTTVCDRQVEIVAGSKQQGIIATSSTLFTNGLPTHIIYIESTKHEFLYLALFSNIGR